MFDCSAIDLLVTPYIDRELPPADRQRVADHLRVCVACRSRLTAEQSAREAIRAAKPVLQQERAPDGLLARCTALAEALPPPGEAPGVRSTARVLRRPAWFWRGSPDRAEPAAAFASSRHGATDRRRAAGVRLPWASRLAPLGLAATLVLIVAGAFLYRLTESSAHLMAAQLTADHVKCFALNTILGTHQAAAVVESSMASSFHWPVRLPDQSRTGLELVGSRPCLYGEGRVAHIMFRHNGRPVSLFMLPGTARSEQLVDVLGHEAAIWCIANRTFVLIANESRSDVERMASIVRASLR